MRPAFAAPLGLLAFGGAGLGYSVLETRWFVLRRATVPMLGPGERPLKVLHLSDVHMRPSNERKQRWLRQLTDLSPDLVVNTGDNLAHFDAVPSVLDAYGGLLDVPGVFVFGSNDYFSPVLKNPARYLFGGTGSADPVKPPAAGSAQPSPSAPPSLPDKAAAQNSAQQPGQARGGRHPGDLPFEELRAAFCQRGWQDLNNRSANLQIDGRSVSFLGVDDPHLEYDVLTEQPAEQSADLAIGVTHAPYLRVLDHMNRLGYPLILAGHTHGGQLRIPFAGALVTNCDLEPARARGLHTHQTPGHEPSWLNVSAGLGTSPYAPVRCACRPEATLLTLAPIDSPGLSA